MCDFFSGVVFIDGKFYHGKHNSHSRTVSESGRRENDLLIERFSEIEADAAGGIQEKL